MSVPSAATNTFCDSLAEALLARSAALAERWRERAAAAAPRPALPVGAASEGEPEEGAEHDAESAVRALLASLQKDARWHGEVIRAGWQAGAGAHQAGLAPHHVLSDAELLVAIVLAAAEQHAVEQHAAERHSVGSGGDDGGGPVATAADGIAAARRLQRAGALYGHAAAASFLHAIVAALRARYRILRHDLRNPIGTIRGAVSLMEDESVPSESRYGPNVRAMLTRNAVSLDRMVSAQLDDVAADSLLATPREVSLRELALAARRALREPSRHADCDVVVGDDLPVARVDAAAVELALSALLLAGLARAEPGSVLRVDALPADGDGAEGAGEGSRHPEAVTLRVRHEGASRRSAGEDPVIWDPEGLALAASVAAEFGARLGATPPSDGGRVRRSRGRHVEAPDPASLSGAATLFVEVPVLPAVAESPSGARAAPPREAGGEPTASTGGMSARHQRDDLARAD